MNVFKRLAGGLGATICLAALLISAAPAVAGTTTAAGGVGTTVPAPTCTLTGGTLNIDETVYKWYQASSATFVPWTNALSWVCTGPLSSGVTLSATSANPGSLAASKFTCSLIGPSGNQAQYVLFWDFSPAQAAAQGFNTAFPTEDTIVPVSTCVAPGGSSPILPSNYNTFPAAGASTGTLSGGTSVTYLNLLVGIPANQTGLLTGAYSDTLTFTMTYN